MKLITSSLAALALTGSAAFASAIIDNGVIQLGVDDLGQLNIPGPDSPVTHTPFVGLRYLPTGFESTSHGCLCEGWGVGIGETLVSGYANNAVGTANLSPVSFSSTASTAVSSVALTSGELAVTHTFGPAAETPNLYRVTVAITNTSGVDIADLRYTRTFDWDIEPTTFSEYVTHAGVGTTPAVLTAFDNGFVDSNPFGSRAPIGGAGFLNGDFVDSGPFDHGSNFDFTFGALAAGETFTFDIFYGGARTEAGALAALGEVGAELYSLGQCSGDAAGTGADGCNTFIFGFSGIGGEVIVPDPTPSGVPVPAGGLLILTGLGALAGLRRRKARAA